ncbi:MAG: DUF3348 family protein [Hydrogenophaga sp.]|uniref:DUF3348 family protein n=1 Tax=Hydrogenophaga sp. TaxID=1904254 RepID=UPI003D11B83F
MRFSHFNRSPLVRQLAAWWPVEADDFPHRRDIGERLGEWLNVADAIALHSAHQSLPAIRTLRRAGPPPHSDAAQAELQRVRATLAKAIQAPPIHPVEAADAEFAPHHQRYLDQQRRMEMAIDAFRGHLRQMLAQATPRLAQLAALDAVLDQMLGGREQKLLAGVPAFLKARFQLLRQSDPDGWPPHFEHDFQQTLRAELELRLQPVTGLVEALNHDTN